MPIPHVSVDLLILHWFRRGFGLFFPGFDAVSLHFLLVASHSHFPPVLDLCVFFPVVAQTVLAFFREDKIAHICGAHGGVTHKNAPCQRPLKKKELEKIACR